MDTCPLCLDEISSDEIVLDCSHKLHLKCYDLLIASSQRTCPICRAILPLTERCAKDMINHLSESVKTLFLEYTNNESLKISAIDIEFQTKTTLFKIQKQKDNFKQKIASLRDASELVYDRILLVEKDIKQQQSSAFFDQAKLEHSKLIHFLTNQNNQFKLQLTNTLKMHHPDPKMTTRLKVQISSNELEIRQASRKLQQLQLKLSNAHVEDVQLPVLNSQLTSLQQKIKELDSLTERTRTELENLDEIELKLDLRLEKVSKLRITYLSKRRELYESRFTCDDEIDDIHEVLNAKQLEIQNRVHTLSDGFQDLRADDFQHETRKFQLLASQYASDKQDFERILSFYNNEIQTWEFS